MKVTERLSKKVTAGVNLMAKKMVVQNANSACIWLAYQPKFPKEAEGLRMSKKISEEEHIISIIWN